MDARKVPTRLAAKALDAAYSADPGRFSPASNVDALAGMRAALAAVWGDVLDVGDGHHNMHELYYYRMLYNAHAAHGWLKSGLPVVKSWRHHDGEECFGGGWFIVVATLPSGQVSNHYEAARWDLFDVPAVERAPEWDGHTPQQAAGRMERTLINFGRHL